LAHSIGSSLKPVGVRHRLLGGEDFDETFRKWIKSVGVRNVTVQGSGVELRQDKNSFQPGIQTVADGHIDQAVFAAKRHGRFRSVLRQREETLSRTAGKNNRENVRWIFFALPDHRSRSHRKICPMIH
jgi:hypothetical protein